MGPQLSLASCRRRHIIAPATIRVIKIKLNWKTSAATAKSLRQKSAREALAPTVGVKHSARKRPVSSGCQAPPVTSPIKSLKKQMPAPTGWERRVSSRRPLPQRKSIQQQSQWSAHSPPHLKSRTLMRCTSRQKFRKTYRSVISKQ